MKEKIKLETGSGIFEVDDYRVKSISRLISDIVHGRSFAIKCRGGHTVFSDRIDAVWEVRDDSTNTNS